MSYTLNCETHCAVVIARTSVRSNPETMSNFLGCFALRVRNDGNFKSFVIQDIVLSTYYGYNYDVWKIENCKFIENCKIEN